MKSAENYKYYEDIEVGQVNESFSRTVTETDIVNFACLSGDFNPIHVDVEYAKKSYFGKRVAHGLLGLSLASGLPEAHRPWAIEAFMGLDWKFSRPIFVGDTVYSRTEVINKKDMGSGGGIIKISRSLLNQDDEVVQKGNWTLMVKKKAQQ